MAERAHVAANLIFRGEDKTLSFEVFADRAGAAALDVSGWAFVWTLRPSNEPGSPELLRKTSGSGVSIAGTFDSDPDVNTQRVLVELADSDTTGILPGRYYHELRRTDEGEEGVIAFGIFELSPSI